jgi:hypothetical protein
MTASKARCGCVEFVGAFVGSYVARLEGKTPDELTRRMPCDEIKEKYLVCHKRELLVTVDLLWVL